MSTKTVNLPQHSTRSDAGGLLLQRLLPSFLSTELASSSVLFNMNSPNLLPSAYNFVVSGSAINAAATVRESFAKSFVCLTDVNLLQNNINNHFGNKATSGAVVPLKPNSTPHFTGRAHILDKLKEHFSRGDSDELGTRKHFLLYGIGGIGKTQICLKFIEDMSD
jgi:hypothetical protein